MLFPRHSENAVITGDPPNFFSRFKMFAHCEAGLGCLEDFQPSFCKVGRMDGAASAVELIFEDIIC